MRGSAVHGFNINHKKRRIDVYFSINEVTLKKIEFIENKTNLNLSKFKNRIKNL